MCLQQSCARLPRGAVWSAASGERHGEACVWWLSRHAWPSQALLAPASRMQVTSAARQALRRAVLEADPRLVEAMFLCEVIVCGVGGGGRTLPGQPLCLGLGNWRRRFGTHWRVQAC